MMAATKLTQDPRPDLSSDSAAWARLLAIALDESGADGHPIGELNGIRCMGARLVEGRIVRGEMTEGEYTHWRETRLLPYAPAIRRALARMEEA